MGILLATNGRNFGDKETKLKMMEYTNRCFWCNRIVKIYDEDLTYKQTPENCATRDHVFTKSDKRRCVYKKLKIASPCVLSCFKCNGRRGDTIFEAYVEKYAPIKNGRFIFYFSEKFFQ